LIAAENSCLNAPAVLWNQRSNPTRRFPSGQDRRAEVVNEQLDLAREFEFLDLLEKAREIYSELGERAVLSYIRSSFRLLSKVYHPDLNPRKTRKANEVQQRINRVHHVISQMNDDELVELIKKSFTKVASEKKKILVVEDEFGLQDTLRNIFIMEGYETRIAVDGDNGYAVYRQFKPDLVFTDVVMPKINGIELVRKIREEQPQLTTKS
jgi:hypothetical protein